MEGNSIAKAINIAMLIFIVLSLIGTIVLLTNDQIVREITYCNYPNEYCRDSGINPQPPEDNTRLLININSIQILLIALFQLYVVYFGIERIEEKTGMEFLSFGIVIIMVLAAARYLGRVATYSEGASLSFSATAQLITLLLGLYSGAKLRSTLPNSIFGLEEIYDHYGQYDYDQQYDNKSIILGNMFSRITMFAFAVGIQFNIWKIHLHLKYGLEISLVINLFSFEIDLTNIMFLASIATEILIIVVVWASLFGDYILDGDRSSEHFDDNVKFIVLILIVSIAAFIASLRVEELTTPYYAVVSILTSFSFAYGYFQYDIKMLLEKF